MEHNSNLIKQLLVDKLSVSILKNRINIGQLASYEIAAKMRELLKKQPEIRMIFAAAPSQNEFLSALCKEEGIDWSRVTAFHLDDYIGLPDNAPQRFSNYLKDHLFNHVPLGKIFYLISPDSVLTHRHPHTAIADDIEKACNLYTELLMEAPIDIVCMGIGENGHIAFNDPPVADFQDPKKVKLVQLEETCRLQQVHDGCFNILEEVPTHALTLTIPILFSARWLYCMVPGSTKSMAVQRSLQGRITTECPATIIRDHEHATLYLDQDSASNLL